MGLSFYDILDFRGFIFLQFVCQSFTLGLPLSVGLLVGGFVIGYL